MIHAESRRVRGVRGWTANLPGQTASFAVQPRQIAAKQPDTAAGL
jgi:hypothetical protein